IKEGGRARVGDTLVATREPAAALPGYSEPRPVGWASLYPENQDDFTLVRQSLGALRLSDASLSYEEEASGALGRGFRAGFLGMLHLEIVAERLRREFKLALVTTTPSISYELFSLETGQTQICYSPHLFPEETKKVRVEEPWVRARLIMPPEYMSSVVKLVNEHEGQIMLTDNFGTRTVLEVEVPLRELMRQFFDELKSLTSGFASLTYEVVAKRPAEVVRLDLLVAEELVPAFSRIVSRRRLESEAEAVVEKLAAILPRQLFVVKIQARALGRIIASRSLSALKKDVTGYLYGGDITRKRKLWEKQKRGKKKLLRTGTVNIPAQVFVQMIGSGK
ncbi:MAG: elongation factor 4, partial [Patescibacteria group bacterium]